MVIVTRDMSQYCLVVHRALIDEVQVDEMNRQWLTKKPAVRTCDNKMKMSMLVNIIEQVEGTQIPSPYGVLSVARLLSFDHCYSLGRHPANLIFCPTTIPNLFASANRVSGTSVRDATTLLDHTPSEVVKGGSVVVKSISQNKTE